MFKYKIIQNKLFEGIMGREEFLSYKKTLSPDDKNKMVLISISEPNNNIFISDDESATSDFFDILEIKFWDVEKPLVNVTKGVEYYPLTDEQGKEIKDFILKNRDKKFLIHCKAGKSRSAGVGKAVECLINFNGDVYNYRTSHSEIDDYERYAPNQTVFDKITKG